jgi:hypothetical protein
MLGGLSLLECPLLGLCLRLMQELDEARKEGADHFCLPRTSRVA